MLSKNDYKRSAIFGEASVPLGSSPTKNIRYWSPVLARSVSQFLRLLFWSLRISQCRIPYGSESWRVCIPPSASANVNMRLPEVGVRESNRVKVAHRGRSTQDWL